MKSKLFSLAAVCLLCMSMCITVFASTTVHVNAASSVYYQVSLQPAKGGSLYMTYDDNLKFFYQGKDTYRDSCRIDSSVSHKFSALIDRGIIVKPNSGWYFDGFYDKSGKKLSIEAYNVEVIRITIDGVYYYDLIPSYDNPAYRNLTEKYFKNEIKDYIKFLYGTSRYKVMEKLVYYRLPKTTASYFPRFSKMETPSFPGNFSLTKKLSSPDFYAAGKSGFQASYSSSANKVIKVDKKTGLSKITGPGTATITIKVPESGKYCSVIYKVKVSVTPAACTNLSASRTSDKKSVTAKWKGDSRNSGYEIQISDTKSFSKIVAKKTVSSGKTVAAKISTAKSASTQCKYIRIRPFKKSCGQKLYSEYITATIK